MALEEVPRSDLLIKNELRYRLRYTGWCEGNYVERLTPRGGTG